MAPQDSGSHIKSCPQPFPQWHRSISYNIFCLKCVIVPSKRLYFLWAAAMLGHKNPSRISAIVAANPIGTASFIKRTQERWLSDYRWNYESHLLAKAWLCETTCPRYLDGKLQGCRSGPESSRQTMESPIYRSKGTISGFVSENVYIGDKSATSYCFTIN